MQPGLFFEPGPLPGLPRPAVGPGGPNIDRQIRTRIYLVIFPKVRPDQHYFIMPPLHLGSRVHSGPRSSPKLNPKPPGRVQYTPARGTYTYWTFRPSNFGRSEQCSGWSGVLLFGSRGSNPARGWVFEGGRGRATSTGQGSAVSGARKAGRGGYSPAQRRQF